MGQFAKMLPVIHYKLSEFCYYYYKIVIVNCIFLLKFEFSRLDSMRVVRRATGTLAPVAGPITSGGSRDSGGGLKREVNNYIIHFFVGISCQKRNVINVVPSRARFSRRSKDSEEKQRLIMMMRKT